MRHIRLIAVHSDDSTRISTEVASVHGAHGFAALHKGDTYVYREGGVFVVDDATTVLGHSSHRVHT